MLDALVPELFEQEGKIVFVVGDDDPPERDRLLPKPLVVAEPVKVYLAGSDRIVASFPQGGRDSARHVIVEEQPHDSLRRRLLWRAERISRDPLLPRACAAGG